MGKTSSEQKENRSACTLWMCMNRWNTPGAGQCKALLIYHTFHTVALPVQTGKGITGRVCR